MWFFLVFVCAVAAHPHHRRGPPPCEVPTFIEDLPAEAKEKVKEIWKNYKEGDKCYQEQGLTREVIDSLPKEKRIEIFKSAHGLPFLKKAPADLQAEFKAIMKDRSISRDDKHKKMKELADKKLSGDLLKEFNKFHEKIEEHQTEFKEKVAKLSKEAKEAYDKIEKIEEDKRKVFDTVGEATREELYDLFRERHHFPLRH